MRSKWAVVVVLAMLVLAAVGCHKPAAAPQAKGEGNGGGRPQGPQAVPVVVMPVTLQDYAPALALSGDVRASQRATLAAEVSGKVVAIAHRVGEEHSASAGELISIDPTSYSTAVQAAKADLAEMQEALNRLQNGPRPQEIAVQEAEVAAAQTKVDQAQDNLRRQKELFDQGAVAETALVDAQAAADTAQSELKAAQQVLDTLREGSRREDVAAAKARVDQARTSLQAAEQQLARTSIKPSFDAIVTVLYVEVGQYVGPGTPVCEVVANEPPEVWFNLPQDKVASVKPGAAVDIRTDALPGEVIKGKVISVSPAADVQTRQFPARVAVSDKRLMPGMAVNGRILAGTPKPTLMISADAPLEGKLGLVVYRLVAGGKPAADGSAPLAGVEMVPVETGENLDSVVVLLKGDLKAGDMLVTRGKEQLYSAAKVIPTNLQQPGQGRAADAPKPEAAGSAPSEQGAGGSK